MAQLDSFLQAAGNLLQAVGGQLLSFAEKQGASLLMVFLAAVAALYLNQRIRVRRRRLIARRMRQAIVWEAEANKSILDRSFRAFLDRHNAPDPPEKDDEEPDMREFDTSTSEPHLRDHLFLEHISAEELKTIATYARAVREANEQRRHIEARRATAESGSPKPAGNREAALLNHLLDCEDSIKAVIGLGGKRKE